MRGQEARIGMRAVVGGLLHRIEGRRGMVGTIVGCYGGDEYRAVDVRFSDGARRLFWPQDLEEAEGREAASPWSAGGSVSCRASG